ncbi:hypothetical protein [Rhizobium leguminosarum]|uniref:hypothetical protein n=1 Tax=Rhizobium leguminosarum TaxID=384 RepID=UPI001C980351|nr:hypothetical protein [Rhizobium leguminosarum]MBY5406350.1 hypothetical protein [Rhizobium leguminosarum]
MTPVPSSVPNDWTCHIIYSPAKLHEGSLVDVGVLLNHPDTGDLDIGTHAELYGLFEYKFTFDGHILVNDGQLEIFANPDVFKVPAVVLGKHVLTVTMTRVRDMPSNFKSKYPKLPSLPASVENSCDIEISARHDLATKVALQRSASSPTPDQALWAAIRNRTSAMSFPRYQRFINTLLVDKGGFEKAAQTAEQELHSLGVDERHRPLAVFGPHAYSILKLATQAFLTLESGVTIRERDAFGESDDVFSAEHEDIRLEREGVTARDLERRLLGYLRTSDGQPVALPYLKRIVRAFISLNKDDPAKPDTSPFSERILRQRFTSPSMLELIWSYWLEEGMLVQTINAIALRFQNRRSSPQDPLGELEFDPLRPLNNLLWGYIQDEHNRLTVSRRAYEYQHHYGLVLQGKAVRGMVAADTRSKFIEAFHNLLYRTSLFYREDRDTTVIADAFPLLNALKEVHLILAEGAHNQFGDLTWTSRGEMLINQWMLARPEMREFLRGRYMVPYQEGWMGAVDCMKKLQGWSDTSITHFHELAVTGERILLSIRYGDWVDINNIEEQAKNWARSCKPEIQRYLHGYQAVTGIDLAAETTEAQDGMGRLAQPSKLLQRRLVAQRSATLGRRPASTRAIGAPTTTIDELPIVRPAQKYLAEK